MILVVDDSKEIRKILTAMVSDHGYETIEGADGLEAIALFEKHVPELEIVFMDISMPRMSGMEALEKMQEMSEDVPIVLMSGDIYDLATPFLLKPFQSSQVIGLIRILGKSVG